MENKIYLCAVSREPIPDERVEALIMLGVPEKEWTKVEYSQTRKVKGIYMGESGVSELKFCSKVSDTEEEILENHEEKE
jgi:hypothetical protein